MVERHLAKVNVEGSNPFSRSTLRLGSPALPQMRGQGPLPSTATSWLSTDLHQVLKLFQLQ